MFEREVIAGVCCVEVGSGELNTFQTTIGTRLSALLFKIILAAEKNDRSDRERLAIQIRWSSIPAREDLTAAGTKPYCRSDRSVTACPVSS